MSFDWKPMVDLDLARRAQEIARAVGSKIRDPEALFQIEAVAEAQRASTGGPARRDPSLASGHAGVALLAAYLDACRPGEGWDRVGHRHLAAAVVDTDRLSALGPSLHGGWGGLVLAAAALARGRPRYATF